MYRYVKLIVCLLALLAVGGMGLAQESALNLDVPGKIAYVGRDYNIYSIDLASDRTFQLTEDASNTRHYQWPTWSRDGRLAYFCCDLQIADQFNTNAYVSPDGHEPGEIVFTGRAEAIIYAYWAPSSCQGSETCLDLALLLNNLLTGGLSVNIIRDQEGEVTSQRAGAGSPFYYSWNPAGTELVFHRNGERLDIYDVMDSDISETIEVGSSGLFQAPAWSPVDDRILFGTPGNTAGQMNLSVYNEGELRTVVQDLNGFVSFLWSPDGRYIAYRVIDPDTRYGSLFVIDAETGEVVARSSTNGVLAFFWSPDSSRIAYIALGADGNFNETVQLHPVQQQQPALTWHTLEVENGLNRQHTSFLPTNEMIYLMLYFDQFAQSHRIWSPDSTHIVYGEVVDVNSPRPSVSILDVTRLDTVPLTVADGVFAIWSFS